MTSLALKVKDDIVQLVKNDELVLPTLPEVALQIRQVAEDSEAGVAELSQVVARDPALSARLVKIANSPLVRASANITDLSSAISRLGVVYTSNIAVGLAMEQMFQATHEIIDKRLRQCWSHSLEIAATAQVLARHFTNLPADQAMLAGLVHQIGMLPILAYAENNSELLADSLSLDYLLEKMHPALGAYILQSWKFSPELICVPKEYLNLKRDALQADFTDLVQVATLQSYAGTEHPLAKVDRSQLSSFKRLGLSVVENGDPWSDCAEEIVLSSQSLTN